jgi:Kdo2-lipid IVA lauroyltransferase/acyltransferase
VGAVILFFLRGLAGLYLLAPRWLRRFWGNALGALLRGLGLRARVVRQNLAIAFKDSTEKQVGIFWHAYAHLGNLVLEILLLLGPMKRYVLRDAELVGLEHWQQAHARGKGVLFLASHVGNWEVMAATGALKGGMDLMLVTKHLKPEWLHQAIEAGRARCGVRATYEPRTLRDVLSHLKKKGTVGFILDQYAGPPIGVRVPVFGVPVGTTTVIATLARRTGAAVLPVVNYRTPEGGWKVVIRPAIDWKENEDSTFELAENTARYSAELERDIYAHPEQWLWIHRRFKGDLEPLRPGEWSDGRARI